jgi:hypothetical protein
VIDARSFRLQDGREVILAGIEPAVADKEIGNRTSALAALVADREVTLRGEDDAPDRYGRQPAFAFLDGAETSVQGLLLAQGEALVSASVANKDCASTLMAAETAARETKRGIWADPAAIKNAESPGDILTGIGRFTVVEGKVFGPAVRGDHVPQLRTELDTGLCCDYFKAREHGARGYRFCRKISRE